MLPRRPTTDETDRISEQASKQAKSWDHEYLTLVDPIIYDIYIFYYAGGMNSITFFLQYQIIGLRTSSHHIPYQSNTIEMYHFDRDNYGVSKNQFHVVRWFVVVVPVS